MRKQEILKNEMNTHSNNSVSIEVNNFGPISEAKVDLRPLTVLVGPSNTGKSYFAILVNALQRSLSRTRNYPPYYYDIELEIGSISYSKFSKIIKKTAESLLKQLELENQENLEFDHDFQELVKNIFNKRLSTFSNNEILRCFGIDDVNSLSRRGKQNSAQIKVKTSAMCSENLENHSIELSPKPKHNFIFPSSLPLPPEKIKIKRLTEAAENVLQDSKNSEKRGRISRFEIMRFLNAIISIIKPLIIGPLDSQAFYLPADRTGIMHAHTVVVNSLIASAPMAGLRKTTGQATMTGVLADFLEQLIEIGSPRIRRRKRDKDLSKGIEKEILKGRVNIKSSEEINYPIFTYQPKGWAEDLPLANASSMISELAPIVLFLRYAIRPGMLLIIEEPESHLHPAMQVELTNQLANLVNEGIRVVVTTHSEWMVEALANIVYRSKITEKYDAENSNRKIALNEDQVGLWLFQKNRKQKGTVVKEIKLDDAGQYPIDYDDVAIALHNDWAEITEEIVNS